MADMNDEKDLELEDGECSASDDDQAQYVKESSVSITSVQQPAYWNNQPTYRSQIPQIVINSDQSDYSSGDDSPSLWKKSRSPCDESDEHTFNSSDRGFVNPLLSSNSNSSSALQRKRNNIWGSVITEQFLANGVRTFGVNNSAMPMDSRDVESYDYTQAKGDERPSLEINPEDLKDELFGEIVDLEREVKRHDSRKRKRNVKDRLGKRTYNRHKPRNLGVTAENDVPEVVSAITTALSEPKVDLFSRIVESIGKELAIKLYYMTEDLEDAGGMLTNDGYRRRTQGGVYIQLLKNDESVSADTIKTIFETENLEWKNKIKIQRKMKKAARKKRKKQAARPDMDIDRPDTPTPGEDLEVLNALDSNNEFDTTDLPERPATPEPKDDSSDGQEDDEDGEDDEEEDIAVAIAKAKAAILKKQRELASESNICCDKVEVASLHSNLEGSDCGSCKDNEMMDDGDKLDKLSTQDDETSEVAITPDAEVRDMEDA